MSTEAKRDAAQALLTPEDGNLIGAFSSIEGRLPGMGAGAGFAGQLIQVSFFAGVLSLVQRLLGRKATGVGMVFAVTDTGVVVFKQDHKRIPIERIRRYEGHSAISDATRPDLQILHFDANMFNLQKREATELARILGELKAAA